MCKEEALEEASTTKECPYCFTCIPIQAKKDVLTAHQNSNLQ